MLHCQTAVPALLQVSRESRTEILKHYIAPAHIPGSLTRLSSLCRYYFDPSIDTIVIQRDELFEIFREVRDLGDLCMGESPETLQYVILGPGYWRLAWTFFDPTLSFHDEFQYRLREVLLRLFRILSSLKKLVLVGTCTGLHYDYQRLLCVKA